MSPLIRAMLLLAAGQVAGQVASAMVGARLDPVTGAPQGSLPVGGGLTRSDDAVMVGGSAGMLYLAARQTKNPTARIFLIGMAMGFITPVTQAIATALANRVVGPAQAA